MTENILKALKPLAVPIESLHPDPANTRKHDAKSIAMLKASLEKYGQRKPVVVQEKGRVVRAGNGLYLAAKELGWKKIAAVVVPEGDVEATAYSIADNRSAEFSAWDNEALAATLTALTESEIDLATVGFTEEELEFLVHGPNDPREEWDGMPEFEQEDQDAWKTVKVHFAKQEDMDEFAKLVGQNLTEKTKSIWYPKAEIGHLVDKAYVDEP